MKVSRHAALWISIALTALVLLVLLRHILLPFAIGLALAYLLAPIISTLERHGVNRAWLFSGFGVLRGGGADSGRMGLLM
jgi:predicted PurR-regulated permease PerM